MSPSNRSYILSNLCPGDSTAERQETLSCERVGTIGSQFLEDKRTQEWITGTGLQILWVHGLAATGKTFISSLVVDHIRSTENRSGIAVFYLNNSHRQHNVADFGVAFGSIARQLLAQIPEWSADVFNLVQKYSSFPPLTRGKSGGLWNLVLSAFASAFIIFDGVNASEVALRDMLVQLAGSDAQHADLHILITSRYPPPRSLLRDYALPTIVTRPSDDDLTEYILHELAGKSPEEYFLGMEGDGSIESYLQAADAWPYQDDATYDELEQAEERWAYFPQGYGPLHVAAHIVGGRVFVEALLQRGEDVAARTANDKTALHIAAGIEDEVETARSLLEHGADVDAVDDSGETPLSIAVVEGNLATVRLLLEYGADLGSLDEDILRECVEERPDVAEYLAGLGVSFPSDEESEEEGV
ncbi:hypothetical protein ETB97_007036 [Aspergillus alliaceus]|uniref:Nephrocystin 3-like N-terminal domain-containing protein n=1 Tax=Petromyces alliaceus TaxID=209559 RepID=A0A8H6E291_PETAA|nr:hypothetical protein ETB97_007036 [Aspergillus burnettii]